ncbi:acyl-homoserine-lactone synthase [Mesorhizobium sp. M0227]|uniref:acyl-homoserine-lactone synthase n=1 Tax=Mesorhizobium sp. M0227 TaxID=2956922 RepID=UPI00333C38BF
MEWNVEASDDREVDAFDLLRPTDVLAISSAFDVVGCAPLLTGDRTDYAGERFPQLLATSRLEARAGMVESSRFCVDTSLREGRGGRALHDAVP